MTSADLYTDRYGLDDIPGENVYILDEENSDDKGQFTNIKVPEYLDGDNNDSSTSNESINAQPVVLSIENEGSENYVSTYAKGVRGRRITEPDLHNTVKWFIGNRGNMTKSKRPVSAHGLPNLPVSPFLIQSDSILQSDSNLPTAVVLPENKQKNDSNGKPCHKDLVAADDKPKVIRRRASRISNISPKHTSTYFEGNTQCQKKTEVDMRRRSLDPDMIPCGSLVPENIEKKATKQANALLEMSLTPKSYFQKYGISLEKSQLQDILYMEREILQRRIRIFLAKNNP